MVSNIQNILGDSLEEILGNVPGGVAIFSYDGDNISLEYTNDGFYSTHHGSRKFWDSQSSDPRFWLVESDRMVFEKEFEAVRNGQKPEGNVIYRVTSEDGTPHWILNQFKPAFIRDGSSFFYASFACVDNQIEAEAESDRSRKLFETAVKGNGIKVFEYNPRQHTLTPLDPLSDRSIPSESNTVVENVPEYFAKEVEEESYPALSAMYKALDDGAPTANCDIWFKATSSSGYRCEHVECSNVFDDEGKPSYAYGTSQDITAQKLIERRLSQMYSDIVKANPKSLGTFRLNLTKNICSDGLSPYASVLAQQSSGTVDGYLAANANTIQDNDIKREYLKKFTRENLIDSYNAGTTEIMIEYPVLSSQNSIIWIDGFVNMALNQVTGDVEAVTYALDVTSRKTEEVMLTRVVEDKYDHMGLIDIANRTFELRSNIWKSIDLPEHQMFDYDPIVKQIADKDVAPEDRAHFLECTDLNTIASHMNEDGSFDFEFRCVDDDGSARYKHEEYSWLDSAKRIIINTQSDVTEAHLREQEELVRASEALRAEEQIKSLERIVDGIPAGLAVYRQSNGKISAVIINQYLADLAKASRESILSTDFNTSVRGGVHPDDLSIVLSGLEDLFSDKNQASFTYRTKAQDSDEFVWLNATGKAISNPDGSKTAYVLYMDATEQKQREADFNRRLSDLSAANPNALRISQLNLSKNLVIQCTVSLEDPTSISDANTADEFFDRCSMTVVDSEDRAMCISTANREQFLQDYESGNNNISFEFRRLDSKTGKWRWTTSYYSLAKNPSTGDIEAVAYTLDSHDSVMNRKVMSRIADSDYEYMAMLDVENRTIEFMNMRDDAKSTTPTHTADYDEDIKYAFLQLYDRDVALEHVNAICFDRVLEALDHDGFLVYSFILPGADGQPLRKQLKYGWLDESKGTILLTRTDITAAYRQELLQMQRLRTALESAEQASMAKTEFLSRMSHEIRTPMNAIIGLNAIALQENDLSPAMVDHLQKIGISAHFLLSLINDILDMSRIESGKMALKSETFDFEEFINGINTIMYEQCRDNELDYECILKSFTEESYVGDKTKLQQILINILGNSIKFTPSGGSIHLYVEQVSRTKTKAKMRFEISDTGIGIDEDFIPHLFEAFSQENRGRTSSYGGTGLGLAISNNIVKLMDGSIDVHSIKGIGSRFTVEVELELPEKATRHSVDASAAHLLPLFTLIVDDDVDVCHYTQMKLSEAGLKAEWASSGHDAIDRVIQNHRKDDDYDLILLDWQMPDMDGIETAREIRKTVGPDVTIIIITAYDWADIENKAIEAGVDMLMKKPVFVSSVTKAFENVFARKSADSMTVVEPEYDFTGRRILVAEDNDINAEIAQTVLENKGCKVDLAENGVAAIEAFSSNPVGYYDAILMDVRMPVMDGIEATRTIRAMRKSDSQDVIIIAMTANAFQEDVDATLSSGMNAHLAKPIEPNMLYEMLNHFLK